MPMVTRKPARMISWRTRQPEKAGWTAFGRRWTSSRVSDPPCYPIFLFGGLKLPFHLLIYVLSRWYPRRRFPPFLLHPPTLFLCAELIARSQKSTADTISNCDLSRVRLRYSR